MSCAKAWFHKASSTRSGCVLGDTAREAKSLVESMTDANRRSAIPESRFRVENGKSEAGKPCFFEDAVEHDSALVQPSFEDNEQAFREPKISQGQRTQAMTTGRSGKSMPGASFVFIDE